MENLQLFKNDSFQIRIIKKEGNPWFHAGDCCKNLELDNVGQALTRLDNDEKDEIISNDVVGRKQNMWFVNEPGFYSLVVSSRKPEAKEFKRWITHDIIPSIRKTGTYSIQPKTIEDLIILQAQSMKEIKSRVEQTETTITTIKETIIDRDDNWRK